MSESCYNCFGTGIIITCCDDMCANSGYCIHGDGEEICPVCDGDGELYDDDDGGYADYLADNEDTNKRRRVIEAAQAAIDEAEKSVSRLLRLEEA